MLVGEYIAKHTSNWKLIGWKLKRECVKPIGENHTPLPSLGSVHITTFAK